MRSLRFAFVGILLIAGCKKPDWEVIRRPEQGFVAAFPTKPAYASLGFEQWSATTDAGKVSYTLSVSDVSERDAPPAAAMQRGDFVRSDNPAVQQGHKARDSEFERGDRIYRTHDVTVGKKLFSLSVVEPKGGPPGDASKFFGSFQLLSP